MKKLLISMVCCTLMACGNPNNNASQQNLPDSTNLPEQVASVDVEKESSLQNDKNKDYLSPDLKMFGLKGKVKAVSGPDSLFFSEDGKLVYYENHFGYDSDEWQVFVERDSKGRISHFYDSNYKKYDGDGGFIDTLVYNDNDLIIKEFHDTEESSSEYSYKYNSDDELVYLHKNYSYFYDESDSDEEMSCETETNFTITKRDSNGNWIERNEKIVETRPRTKAQSSNTQTFSRKIYYY